MSGSTGNTGKAGSSKGKGNKAKPAKPKRRTLSPIKGTTMAKKAPAKKPALHPVPYGVTNLVHGGTPAKPPKPPKPKAPIPPGTTIITHGAKLLKPHPIPPKPHLQTYPGPSDTALAPPAKPKKAKGEGPNKAILYVDPQYHDAGATPLVYVAGNVNWPGGADRSRSDPKQFNDVGTYRPMRTVTTMAQVRAAHLTSPPAGVTFISPLDRYKPHSHKFVTPSRFVDPFFSDHPFPYDPEDINPRGGGATPLPPGYWQMQEKLNTIALGNAIANFFLGADDFNLFPYPEDTEVQP